MSLGSRVTQHAFSMVPSVNLPRSVFDRSFGFKDSAFFDKLNPCFVDEILPGDTINLNVNAFFRLAPMVNPPMDNMYVDFFFFFVPNRLVWTNWEKFCGAQDNPGDTTSFSIPTTSITVSANTPGELYEKMGIPLGSGTQVVNALPFRGWNLIYNTWFRDENLQNSTTVPTDNGPDTYATTYAAGNNVNRNKRHDYFTSALPWPQKGTAINILPADPTVIRVSNATHVRAYLTGTDTVDGSGTTWQSDGGGYLSRTSDATRMSIDPRGSLTVDADTAGTINQLRTAFQVQSLLELDARGGTRYVELTLAHFGVQNPDYRLQRPEYLGGGQMRINTHAVPQMSPTSGSAYFAQLGAFATGSVSERIGFSKSFTEHGYVIGMWCARADVTYQRGIEKMWKRSTRYDFFWPKLQEIGEQAIYNYEIWADSTGSDTTVFGYQERYAEYKYKPSRVAGYFASDATGTLESWHLAQDFTSVPSLNSSFIASNTPISRALANASAVPVLADIYYSFKHTRVMGTYNIPAGLGRF